SVNSAIQVSFRPPAERGVAPRRRRADAGRARKSSSRGAAPMAKLTSVNGHKQAPGGGRRRDGSTGRPSVVWLVLWTLLGVAGAVGAVLAGASVTVAACVVVLACAAAALGWRFGENSRAKLVEENEGRTRELKRAL